MKNEIEKFDSKENRDKMLEYIKRNNNKRNIKKIVNFFDQNKNKDIEEKFLDMIFDKNYKDSFFRMEIYANKDVNLDTLLEVYFENNLSFISKIIREIGIKENKSSVRLIIEAFKKLFKDSNKNPLDPAGNVDPQLPSTSPDPMQSQSLVKPTVRSLIEAYEALVKDPKKNPLDPAVNFDPQLPSKSPALPKRGDSLAPPARSPRRVEI
ncbi:MAG: hypothetical protein FJX30_02530 [Alphaproteobacteria bacterium]|nr:hypothetical protein [Alphaproteobacteria bacterium]